MTGLLPRPPTPVHDGSTIVGFLDTWYREHPIPAPTNHSAIRLLLDGQVIEVPGGLLVTRCHPGHPETLGCWAFYANRRRLHHG
jgi:hypothetical protein